MQCQGNQKAPSTPRNLRRCLSGGAVLRTICILRAFARLFPILNRKMQNVSNESIVLSDLFCLIKALGIDDRVARDGIHSHG